MKKCSKCKEVKPLGKFFKSRKNKLSGKNKGRMSQCKECSQKAHRIAYEQKKQNKTCIHCGKPIDTEFVYCSKCKEAKNRRQRKAKINNKRKAINHYGGKCNCCGETILAFLTIDHINGGGRKHREQIKGTGCGEHMHRWLRKNNYPKGYQVLCFNCNCGRQVVGGICPHKEI